MIRINNTVAGSGWEIDRGTALTTPFLVIGSPCPITIAKVDKSSDVFIGSYYKRGVCVMHFEGELIQLKSHHDHVACRTTHVSGK